MINLCVLEVNLIVCFIVAAFDICRGERVTLVLLGREINGVVVHHLGLREV